MAQAVVISLAVIFGGLALLCAFLSLWVDRPRGRMRCPKCRYDLKALVAPDAMPGDVPPRCPECGVQAKRVRSLSRLRIAGRPAFAAIAFGALLAFVLWLRAAPIDRALYCVPTDVVIWAVPRAPVEWTEGNTPLVRRLCDRSLSRKQYANLLTAVAEVINAKTNRKPEAAIWLMGLVEINEEMRIWHRGDAEFTFRYPDLAIGPRLTTRVVESDADDTTRGTVLLALFRRQPEDLELYLLASSVPGFKSAADRVQAEYQARLSAQVRAYDVMRRRDAVALGLMSDEAMKRQEACETCWRMGAAAADYLPQIRKLAREDPDSLVRKVAYTTEQHIENEITKSGTTPR